MKKISLIFIGLTLFCAHHADAAPRDVTRSARPATSAEVVSRSATTNISTRGAAPQVAARSATSTPARSATQVQTTRSATQQPLVRARAATETQSVGTRTGMEYDQCKSAYFACMDQFCAIKDPTYQRCSCSDKIYDITAAQGVMRDAGAQLTTFTESLDVVGMSAAQAEAMRKASEGELALTGDKSASKALLQAIMNSIKGENATVGGAYEGLNSINIKMDESAGFGFMDSGQAIAAYNGKNLYTAIYGKCREAVRGDCNDAALQRAVTAYLMAVEQDCNTVQRQIDENKKKMAAAVREGGAMLNLARVQDRQERNSSDATECLRNVEKAVQSEEVCGLGYRKCLDNGKFIDVTTGRPLEGVVEFFRLQEMLSFTSNISLGEQKLARNPNNRTFVTTFEKKVRQFAQPSLDKCTEIADQVWADYLDKAMLEIYYSQREKVDEIKTGCMDFVSACYMNGSHAITAAMAGLINSAVDLTPGMIDLQDATCQKYVTACDYMFSRGEGQGIIAQYIENRKNQDLMDSCRAVVKQCFDNFGGVGYNNFYNPISGIFSTGRALDWFTFKDESGSVISPCARQLIDVTACNFKTDDNADFALEVFGGFDKMNGTYGLEEGTTFNPKSMHSRGVATEIYNQITNRLSSECQNYGGRFVQKRFLSPDMYSQFCVADFSTPGGFITMLAVLYDIVSANGVFEENMCPMDYGKKIDTTSWGICSCWENGGRRSANGTSLGCSPERYNTYPSTPAILQPDPNAVASNDPDLCNSTSCQRSVVSLPLDDVSFADFNNKVCPFGLKTTGTSGITGSQTYCNGINDETFGYVPKALQ